MASFTGVGDNTTLSMKEVGETVSMPLSSNGTQRRRAE